MCGWPISKHFYFQIHITLVPNSKYGLHKTCFYKLWFNEGILNLLDQFLNPCIHLYRGEVRSSLKLLINSVAWTGALLKNVNSRKLRYTSPLKTRLHLIFNAESHSLQFYIAHELPEVTVYYFNVLQKVMRVGRFKAFSPLQIISLCVYKETWTI